MATFILLGDDDDSRCLVFSALLCALAVIDLLLQRFNNGLDYA
jgi:hypothetical protein